MQVVNKILMALSLSRKAGFLKMGFDPAWDSLGKGSCLILYSSDVSIKTKERMNYQANRMNVRALSMPFTTAEILFTIGKNIAVMSVTDKGFAQKIIAMLEQELQNTP